MAAPQYVARIARLPRVFERLGSAPAGLTLGALAADVDVPVDELREDLLAFYAADVGSDWLLGLARPASLEFLSPDGEEADPAEAEVVRLVTTDAAEELGVEYVDASELALIYTAASALRELEPDDEDLAGAIDVLTATVLQGLEDPGGRNAAAAHDADVTGLKPWQRALPVLEDAVRNRTAVRIDYSRSWAPGVTARVIHPYRLEQTRRGWEVDAGPLDGQGQLRTFLVSNINSAEPLTQTFERLDDLAERIAEQRATTTVRVVLPQSGRWAADRYAESVSVVQDDEESVAVDVALLPPLARRVGVLLLAAGPEAFVVDPPELFDAGKVRAEELLLHHLSAPQPAES